MIFPQFSFVRENKEVVELKDYLDRSEDGTIQVNKKSWWNAITRARPELQREFGHAQAKRELRMEDRMDQIRDHTEGREPREIDYSKWWWK